MKIKGAIFDVDGTLLDSMQIWSELGKRYLESIGISAQPGLAKILFPMTLDESSIYLKRTYKLPFSVDEITADTIGILHDFYEKEAQPKNGAVDFIRAMHHMGLKLSIATAGDRRILTRLLNRLGLAQCFSAVLTCTELSTSKREPTIYQKAAELMGTKACETVVFEDVLHALTTASNAGFITVGIGDPSSFEDRDAIIAASDYFYEDFLEPLHALSFGFAQEDNHG